MNLLEAGKNIQILSLKYDRTFHRRWLENIVFYHDEQILIGGNNQTIVEEATKTWQTEEPAIFFFHTHYWFNVIIIFQQPTHYYFYCNLISPFTYNQQTIQYIDYDIDVIVQKDLSYKIVDEEEYILNKQQMGYPKEVQQQVEAQLKKLQSLIENGSDPFNEAFVKKWYQQLFNREK